MTRLICILLFSLSYCSSYSQQPKLMLPVGHASETNSARFSHSGKYIVTASTDRVAKIWNAIDGKLFLDLVGHKEKVNDAIFSPDDKRVATASEDDSVKIWDALTGKVLHTFFKQYGGFRTLAFSPDGKLLACKTYAGLVYIWDTQKDTMVTRINSSDVYDKNVANVFNLIKHNLIPYSHWSDTLWLLKVPGLSVVSFYKGDKAAFSPDGNTIALRISDSIVSVLDYTTQSSLARLRGHRLVITLISFSKDGKKIITTSDDKTAKIWDVQSGKLLTDLTGHQAPIRYASMNWKADRVITLSKDDTLKFWDAVSGKLLWSTKDSIIKREYKTSYIDSVFISADGQTVITFGRIVKVLDARTGILLKDFDYFQTFYSPGIQIAADGTKLLFPEASAAFVWDVNSRKKTFDLEGHCSPIQRSVISPDKKMLAISSGNNIQLWNLNTNKPFLSLRTPGKAVESISFSHNSKRLLSIGESEKIIWDIQKGSPVFNVPGNGIRAFFSPDDSKILAGRNNIDSLSIWDISSGKMIKNINYEPGLELAAFNSAGNKVFLFNHFNKAIVWDLNKDTTYELEDYNEEYDESGDTYPCYSDGKLILIPDDVETDGIWDLETGKRITNLQSHWLNLIRFAEFSPDHSRVAIATDSGLTRLVRIYDTHTGKIISRTNGYHNDNIHSVIFSNDGKKIMSASADAQVKIWDVATGKNLVTLKGHSNAVTKAIFSSDEKLVYTVSNDNTCGVWDAVTGNQKFSFFGVDTSDYMVLDKGGHYEGSEGAKKLLYFTCGPEIIELEQLKDQLWVPNLAQRILKGDSINAKTLSQLNICGLTPEVEEIKDKNDALHYKIFPRRGGLGETALYVNGIEIKRYKKEQLQNKAGTYELVIPKHELSNYFIAGQENPVTVKSWVADNTISSRGLIINENKTKESAVPPNLYAVMVGVSDYKGDELDLKYAAKDATDISNAVSTASRKLLNSDGKEHVFIYNLTTTDNHYQLPEKIAIKKILEEIGKKAIANDILLIFFAGHGVMEGTDKKQFYFLTADASKSSAVDAIADVGISTTELTEWMKPANIKAQKRILIFDACNSGQAIRDIVQIGKPNQGYIAARSDENGQQIKAIEKLNNQSGLIILAASASDQSAYEMGRYSQGLLTYSLLKVMKQQPEILENGKYLDVTNWLNAAKKLVSNLIEGTGARQEPQLNSNNNFNIGLIDDEVRSKIVLPMEKPLFTRSFFVNADTKIDNLKLGAAINKEVISISSRGTDAVISYSADYEGADAYSLTGDYKIADNNVTVSVLLIKGGTEIAHRFEVKGVVPDINHVATSIANTVIEWLKKK